MSSLIPKISIGVDSHRSKFDLSCMTHTTSEIGYVSPTLSKYIVPNSKVRIGTRTGSRLSPLFVPTMGQLDIRHYHCFIPFSTLWTPWDAFITNTNYTLPSSQTYIPKKVPYFTVNELLDNLLQYGNDYSSVMYQDLTLTIYQDGYLRTMEQMKTIFNASLSGGYRTALDSIFSGSLMRSYLAVAVKCSDGYLYFGKDSNNNLIFSETTTEVHDLNAMSFPTMDNCDFTDGCSYDSHTYTFCYNFNGALKRLRTVFMGLGYSFNPYDTEKVTILKLLAFYKAYWNIFGVNRNVNFYNTYCYKLIKRLSDNQITDVFQDFWDDAPSGVVFTDTLFVNMCMYELTQLTYTCPPDYFSASDTNTQRGANEQTISIKSPTTRGTSTPLEISGVVTNNATPSATQAGTALGMQIAQRLLRFVNKNSVIGRQVSDLLRARYGVTDIHNQTHEGVMRVGSSSVPIQISAIYNQQDGGDMPLGSYAGLGVGSHRSKEYTFKTSEFGVLISLVAVVPKMGYFQGMFRENSDGVNDRFDFWTPEFDAMGWQSVRYNEMISDRQFYRYGADSDTYGTNLGIFGYNPRYQHYKVSFNRALADISLPSMQDSMLPYTLDRFFPQKKTNHTGNHTNIEVPVLPVNDPQTFRSGTQGQTNRIFSSTSKTEDHVIMQIYFDLHMSAPMKPISTSYDTWDEDSTHSTDVSHE